MDAFARLMRAHAALTRELSARLLTDHGLSITDYQCLLTLAHAEDGAMRRVTSPSSCSSRRRGSRDCSTASSATAG